MISSDLRTKSKTKGKGNYESYDRKPTAEDPLRGSRVPPQDLESEKALLGSLPTFSSNRVTCLEVTLKSV